MVEAQSAQVEAQSAQMAQLIAHVTAQAAELASLRAKFEAQPEAPALPSTAEQAQVQGRPDAKGSGFRQPALA